MSSTEHIFADKTTKRTITENSSSLTSLEASRLKSDAWLTLLRRRWAVENESHNIWDRIPRAESSRATPSKELLGAIHVALTVATVTMLEGIRSRPQATF